MRKLQSFRAASVTSKPNFTAKKGSDCGQTDATTTLCLETSHVWRKTQTETETETAVRRQPPGLRADRASDLVEGQNLLHLLQVLLRDLHTLLLGHAAVTGQTGTQQQLRAVGRLLKSRQRGDGLEHPLDHRTEVVTPILPLC